MAVSIPPSFVSLTDSSPYNLFYCHNQSIVMERNTGFLGSIKKKIGSMKSSTSPRQNSFTRDSDRLSTSNTVGTPSAQSSFSPPSSSSQPLKATSGDAPPVYTAAPNSAPLPQTTTATADDRYAFLSTFDTVFLIDDSGSMAGCRWRETERAISAIAPICTQHDKDGIDIHFLHAPSSPYHLNITSAATVHEIFSTVRPKGSTPTGQRLHQLLRPYLERCERRGVEAVKPLNVIVITDGVPSDDVESPLIATAKRLDRLDAPAWQVGVQFFQVGRDKEAKAHLQSMDDELSQLAKEDIRDIVDTVPFKDEEGAELTGEGILKVVLGAVVRRMDRKEKGLHA